MFEEAFGDRPKIRKGPHANYELSYHSLPLGRFLRQVLGSGMARSRHRMVPTFVFSLPAEKRAGFVRGFFDGEGWVGDHQVAAVSSSPYLLAGIQQLLSSLGVDSHVSRIRPQSRSFAKGPYFTLTISDVGAFAEAVGFCSLPKKRLIEEPPAHAFTRTETLPKASVTNLEREIVLARVTSVETIEAPQTVYDFVLEGHPYFVANQVVTHNCDQEFEAFLLEVLSEFQVTIPEIGTIRATQPPYVVLTSNRSRELSDALRRRCLYLWIDYPPFEKEVRIVMLKVPGVNARLAREVSKFMESLRKLRLSKVPGVAETLDWALALTSLHADHLDETLVTETLGCVLKDADDIRRFKGELGNSGLGRLLPLEG
jgi:hypothetical protein